MEKNSFSSFQKTVVHDLLLKLDNKTAIKYLSKYDSRKRNRTEIAEKKEIG
jgi:hypothetical protein